MEQCQEELLPQCNIIVHEDTSEAYNIKPMPCPLCKSVLRLYQIHFDEKFLMCGNVECAYPIGITDYHIYKIDCTEECVKSDNRYSSQCSSVTSGSTISVSDWTELEKSLGDGTLSPSSTPSPSLIERPKDLQKLAKIKEKTKNEDIIRNNLKQIKELHKQLLQPFEECDSIDNEKWIKHIAKMEQRSGVQLLKEHELNRVKGKVPGLSVGELKIDIASTGDTVSLKIEVDDSKKS